MSINKKAFGQAMDAALDGPERKHVKFRNHDFQIRPIKKTPNGNGVHVQGHMFHQLALRPDDKILYSFDVRNGQTENLDITFESGLDKLVKIVVKVVEVAAKVIETVGQGDEKSDAVPGSIPRTEPAAGTEKELLVNAGFKAEARFLIANIAVRVR
jgi:hypothetical protein